MTKSEAENHAQRIRKASFVIRAEVVRILPANIDPPKEGDDGWDVEVEIKEEGDV